MQWEGRQESQNVDDRRGMGPGTIALGGGGIIIVILGLLFGVNPQKLADMFGGGQQPPGKTGPKDPAEEKLASFTKVVLKDTEDVWDDLFRRMGKTYKKPVLVLFSGSVDSACGRASAAVGPFYCPADHQVYIDLSFYKQMEKELKAPGEFARAYVIAHEVGHHVQTLLGYSARVHELTKRYPAKANELSVRQELQADFLAGVWAHHAQNRLKFLENGDIEDAMNAAHQIGDDELQRKATGKVRPDSFTHGTSRQRMRWFQEGLRTGDLSKADLLFKLDYRDL